MLAKLGAPVPDTPYSTVQLEDRNRRARRLHRLGRIFHLHPRRGKAGSDCASGAGGRRRRHADDATVVRIENGRPRYGEEITERYLVQETGQLQAVHFSKGCYLGQEIVERVRSRAQIHRVLRRIEIDSSEVPPAGTKLKFGDADAAEIASAVFSPGARQSRRDGLRAHDQRRAGNRNHAEWRRSRDVAHALCVPRRHSCRRRIETRMRVTFKNVPRSSSSNASCSSSCVFITIGPYQATGSSSGFPETSRNRIPSSPACTTTSSPRSKSTSDRLSASDGGAVSSHPTPSVGTASGPDALQNFPPPANTYAKA